MKYVLPAKVERPIKVYLITDRQIKSINEWHAYLRKAVLAMMYGQLIVYLTLAYYIFKTLYERL